MSTDKIAKNLRAFIIAVNAHDRENPTHEPAYGIGLSAHDMERLDFEEGEELWPGVRVETDTGVSGNFRVLCTGDHEEEAEAEREEAHAVGVALGLAEPGEANEVELAPVIGPGWPTETIEIQVERPRVVRTIISEPRVR